MRDLLAFAMALMASAGLYLAVFQVVQRPMTVGEVPRMLDAKTAYAQSLPSPRVLVFAGSNGRFSHRCEPITRLTGRPCANMSVAVGIGLDFQLRQLETLLRAGDLLYMPLEYDQYRTTAKAMGAGIHNQVLAQYYPEQLAGLAWSDHVRARASFDLPFLVHGLTEMALEAAGFRRLGALTDMTPQGDATGHSADAGRAYRSFLEAAVFDHDPLPAGSHALDVLGGFLQHARQRGAMVVGGLPTAPDRRPIADEVVARARAAFEGAGHRFLELPGRSQYPLECFFDTLYHLNEGCQIEHSARVGEGLVGVLRAAAVAGGSGS